MHQWQRWTYLSDETAAAHLTPFVLRPHQKYTTEGRLAGAGDQ